MHTAQCQLVESTISWTEPQIKDGMFRDQRTGTSNQRLNGDWNTGTSHSRWNTGDGREAILVIVVVVVIDDIDNICSLQVLSDVVQAHFYGSNNMSNA